MNGLMIHFYQEPAGDDNESTDLCFQQVFAPILEAVGKLYWITLHCASSPFQNAMAGIEAFDRVNSFSVYVEGVDPDLMIQLWRPPLLEQIAVHVRNDWQDFLGVKRDRDPLDVTRRFAELDDRNSMLSPGWTWENAAAIEKEWDVEFAAAIEEETELVFFTNDSGVWEVYAADSHLLDAVQNRCKELGVIHVVPADLGERGRALEELYASIRMARRP